MRSILFGQRAQLEDFYLIYNLEQKIVGIYGLWNQKSFKQTRGRALFLASQTDEAFLSCICAGVRSHAAAENCPRFRLLMLHSALCHPQQMQVQQPALPCAKPAAMLPEASVLRCLGEE